MKFRLSTLITACFFLNHGNNRTLWSARYIKIYFYQNFLFQVILTDSIRIRVQTGSSRTRTGGTSSYRYSSGVRTASSRLTSASGFNSANRFSYTPSSGIYRYGAYSGTRFGTSIRRTTYWPVAAIFYGSPYRSVYRRPLSDSTTSIENQVLISDKYLKQESNNATLYYCVNSANVVLETCYESIEDNVTSTELSTVVSQDDEGFDISDGACCEDRTSGQPVCCIVGLNKAFAMKGIVFTLGCLVLTSTLLALKICRWIRVDPPASLVNLFKLICWRSTRLSIDYKCIFVNF